MKLFGWEEHWFCLTQGTYKCWFNRSCTKILCTNTSMHARVHTFVFLFFFFMSVYCLCLISIFCYLFFAHFISSTCIWALIVQSYACVLFYCSMFLHICFLCEILWCVVWVWRVWCNVLLDFVVVECGLSRWFEFVFCSYVHIYVFNCECLFSMLAWGCPQAFFSPVF